MGGNLEDCASRMERNGHGVSASVPSAPRWKAAVDRALGCSTDSVGGSIQFKMEGSVEPIRCLVQGNAQFIMHDALGMDGQLWSRLPEHMMETIIARLPLESLLKYRSVCKQWNEILHSPSFRSICARIPSEKQSWFLFRGEGRKCAAFNPRTDQWYQIPLSFLPSRVRVVAAAGGFLCVQNREDHLYVCNPLTKSWVRLPRKLNNWKHPIVGMVIDEETRAYKVVVAGSHSARDKDLTTEIYDSSTKSWKLVGTSPLKHQHATNAVFFNGSLYIAGFNAISAFNLEQEQWSELTGPVMEYTQLMLPQICECNGCLLMVQVASERFFMTHVSIWEFPKLGDSWIKVASMPENLLKEVISISGSSLFTFLGRATHLFYDCKTESASIQHQSRIVEMATLLPFCARVYPWVYNFII